MTRQEYKDWAKKKVQAMVEQHAAATALFNQAYDNNDQESVDYYSRRRRDHMNEILAFIE